MIDFETFTKMPKNVRYLGKLIVAEGFKKLPKVQKIAQSGHSALEYYWGHSGLLKVNKSSFTSLRKTLYKGNMNLGHGGGGQVVSGLAFYSDNTSSNLPEDYRFFL